MLEDISISGLANYKSEPQKLAACKQVNYIFGTNGSGKTSVARLISSPENFKLCSLNWANRAPLNALVYNCDFVDRTYRSELQGIFTLGEETVDVRNKIDELRKKKGESERKIASARRNLDGGEDHVGKNQDLSQLDSPFEATCWRYKVEYDESFKNVFEGYRRAKAAFREKVIKEINDNTETPIPIDKLLAGLAKVFDDELEFLSEVRALSIIEIQKLEESDVISKPIIGKDDIDFAALIKHLNNADWVKQGIKLLEISSDKCPFCQQEISASINNALSEYFDEAYNKSIEILKNYQTSYMSETNKILEAITAAVSMNKSLWEKTSIFTEIEQLKKIVEGNRQIIAKKVATPSQALSMEGHLETLGNIQSIFMHVNGEVSTHNAMVMNISEERKRFIRAGWRFIADKLREDYRSYKGRRDSLLRAIQGLTRVIEDQSEEIKKHNNEMARLEKTIVSVVPAVEAINGILTSFGFTSFSLKASGPEQKYYSILRKDGTDASLSLSEGEKTFLVFLYFYHLIWGSIEQSGQNRDMIVVFDDPISSLDSDVLFIVSTLVRKVIDEAIKGQSHIKQVFVLNHNIYFHKEVTFSPERNTGCLRHETFWIIRKTEGGSEIVPYAYNPIKSSYELLWQEVRSENPSLVTLPNTLRRILETYFKLTGNWDKAKIIEKFSGRQKLLCQALLSWINDGSHSVYDDLHISVTDGNTRSYLEVFKAIFINNGHEQHYSMMVGERDPVAYGGEAMEEQIPARPS